MAIELSARVSLQDGLRFVGRDRGEGVRAAQSAYDYILA